MRLVARMVLGTVTLILLVSIVYLLNTPSLSLQLFCSARGCNNGNTAGSDDCDNGDATVEVKGPVQLSTITIPQPAVESPLESVHISVKTTESLHHRLSLLSTTWFQTVPKENLHIVTDAWNASILPFKGFKLYQTTCPKGHGYKCLSCKSGVEFDLFYSAVDKGAMYKWFCHFDDDVYVNAVALQKLLCSYNHSGYWYLGRWRSVEKTARLPVPKQAHFQNLTRNEYYYATGAAYCLSRTLMKKMEVYVRGPKKFQFLSKVLQLPDDMAIGFVVESLLGYELTVVPTIHTHLERLGNLSLSPQELSQQVTISYRHVDTDYKNVISLPTNLLTPFRKDKTRFLSFHCLLYPHISWCKN